MLKTPRPLLPVQNAEVYFALLLQISGVLKGTCFAVAETTTPAGNARMFPQVEHGSSLISGWKTAMSHSRNVNKGITR